MWLINVNKKTSILKSLTSQTSLDEDAILDLRRISERQPNRKVVSSTSRLSLWPVLFRYNRHFAILSYFNSQLIWIFSRQLLRPWWVSLRPSWEPIWTQLQETQWLNYHLHTWLAQLCNIPSNKLLISYNIQFRENLCLWRLGTTQLLSIL